jgi:hypothetical protein
MGQITVPPNFAKSAKTVTVLVLDTYGNMLSGCRIKQFLEFKTNDDRSMLFRGLNGANIPYGEYSVYAACENNRGASSIVVVNRPDAFIVVASARHVADYSPGGGPEFRVAVSNWRTFHDKVWVQLASVFRNERIIDQVHPDSGEAYLSFELPGVYVLTLFAGGQVLCRQPLRIDDVGGDLTVTGWQVVPDAIKPRCCPTGIGTTDTIRGHPGPLISTRRDRQRYEQLSIPVQQWYVFRHPRMECQRHA